MKGLIISNAPHIRTGDSVQKIMGTVVIAMLPAAVAGVAVFGIPALITLLLSTVSAVLTELLIELVFKKKITVADLSAVVTGILVGFNLPAGVPAYVPVTASFFAVAVVKMTFGGLGYNFLNPALAARVFVMFAWLPAMTRFAAPEAASWFAGFFGLEPVSDAVSRATPLAVVKTAHLKIFTDLVKRFPKTPVASHWIRAYYPARQELVKAFGSQTLMFRSLFFGNTGGCIGEVSAFALLIGAAFMMARKVITPVIPFSYLLTVALFGWILGGGGSVLFHLLSGGLILGAFFMATDMVTSPLSVKGQAVFGIGCGVLTSVIRVWGGYPEGVSFSILFMNALTPLLDKYTKPRLFGAEKGKKKKAPGDGP